MDCIFCKIVKGNVPSQKVYEDENTLVFMDIAKDVDGHMVAIPKAHVNSIIDCDEQTLSHLMRTVKKVSNHLIESCDYDGVNLLNASEAAAGQSVPHFHIHIIPRKKDDGIDTWPHLPGITQEIKEIHQKITMTNG